MKSSALFARDSLNTRLKAHFGDALLVVLWALVSLLAIASLNTVLLFFAYGAVRHLLHWPAIDFWTFFALVVLLLWIRDFLKEIFSRSTQV